MPNAILNWDNLISINLSHNQITDFNLLNNKFPKLRKLQINNNPIEDFNFSTKNANKITDLNISGTGLSKINESICEFSNAEILLNNFMKHPLRSRFLLLLDFSLRML